mmetsp:Transcript_10716/g.17745  ORF Transcript_10716/g.17745 Transcript_10716/m.17745 type:complete len:202 (+) Transcript_10716:462-1067(+)
MADHPDSAFSVSLAVDAFPTLRVSTLVSAETLFMGKLPCSNSITGILSSASASVPEKVETPIDPLIATNETTLAEKFATIALSSYKFRALTFSLISCWLFRRFLFDSFFTTAKVSQKSISLLLSSLYFIRTTLSELLLRSAATTNCFFGSLTVAPSGNFTVQATPYDVTASLNSLMCLMDGHFPVSSLDRRMYGTRLTPRL